jgi:antitoxin (DNA-binding transcriptional repressor) of toxin-antitoxin stability system
MNVVSVRVFRRNLTELAERAKAGEQIVVRSRSKYRAMLRAATPAEQLHEIGLGEMRFSLGHCFREVKRGKKWVVTFHGTPELVLTAAPADLTPLKGDEPSEDRS